MASSLHLCALPPPPRPSSLSRRRGLPHPPRRLAIRLSAFSTIQDLLAHFPGSTGVWRPDCGQPRRVAAASGDEAAAVGAESSQDQDLPFDITRLEQYTEKVKGEVLRVHAVVDGEEDQVLIFKGFSSSLMRSTAYDPAEPVLPPSATILAIDRIRGPFNPNKVLLIKGGRRLSWQQFRTLLEEKGL